MFDHLDDPTGVPHEPQRSAAVKARAHQVQARRAIVAAAVLALAVPAGAVALGARDDDGVSVSAEVADEGPRPPKEDQMSPSSVAVLVPPPEVTTTIVVEEPTTTTKPPDYAAVVTWTHRAVLGPEFGSGASGSSDWGLAAPGSPYAQVEVDGLAPGVAHNVLIQSGQPDGSLGEARGFCDFVADVQGHGWCDGDPGDGEPGYVSVMGYDPQSRGYRVTASGAFQPV